MSKNFELLQEIGGDTELFATLGSLPDVASLAEEEPLPELDKEMRAAIFASLPSVFESPDQAIKPSEAAGAEQRPHRTSDCAPKSSLDFPLDDVFGSFGNLTSPVDFSTIFPEFSAGKGLQEAQKNISPSQKDHRSGDSRPSGNLESLNRAGPRLTRQKRFLDPRWIETVKSTARKWRRQLHKGHRLPEVELEAIIREEESKLAQRVFPGTGMDSPRVAVFSGLGGDGGAASVCARIGELLAARAEGPVCVIDANFESPSLHRRFGTENTNGLAEAILERRPLNQYVREVAGPGLCFMPNGRTSLLLSAAEIADRFRTRLAEARGSFWYVVIHAGFLGFDSTAMLISRSTDGVVLVVEANRTRRESAKRVRENISAAKVSLLGVVLNNRTYPIPKVLYQML